MTKIQKEGSIGAVLLLILSLVVLLGTIATINFVQKTTQPINSHAATALAKTGVLSLSPQSATFLVGKIYPLVIAFRTGEAANPQTIDALALRITYPYSGTIPELDITDVKGTPVSTLTTNPMLMSAGWFFPINRVIRQNNKVTIEMASYIWGGTNYSAGTDTTLATMYVTVNRILPGGLVPMIFDTSVAPSSSHPVTVMLAGSNSDNILGTINNGSYTLSLTSGKCGTTGAVCGTGYLGCCSPLICSNSKKGNCMYTGPN